MTLDEQMRAMVGRVLRASTRGFTCGTHSIRIDYRHDFGAFVKVPVANDSGIMVIGVIYAVEIKDDMLVNELVMAESVDPNVMRDQRENRMIPVEISVLNIGYSLDGQFIHSLPPRPPMSLSAAQICTSEEIHGFTHTCDFFRLVLSASEVPNDDLVGAIIRHAAHAYHPDDRYAFLVACGRQIARMLSGDVKRLSAVLPLIRPETVLG